MELAVKVNGGKFKRLPQTVMEDVRRKMKLHHFSSEWTLEQRLKYNRKLSGFVIYNAKFFTREALKIAVQIYFKS